MKKKYYGYFVFGGEEFVIKFRIDGSLRWRPEHRCFMDDEMYVRSIADVICMAAMDSHPSNIKTFGCAFLLSHEYFKNERARGVPRWKHPLRETIIWK